MIAIIYPQISVLLTRWEVISNFIKQHVPNSNKSARDVLAKAKELQKNGKIISSCKHLLTFEPLQKKTNNLYIVGRVTKPRNSTFCQNAFFTPRE